MEREAQVPLSMEPFLWVLLRLVQPWRQVRPVVLLKEVLLLSRL